LCCRFFSSAAVFLPHFLLERAPQLHRSFVLLPLELSGHPRGRIRRKLRLHGCVRFAFFSFNAFEF
jgi:hypothetical protein